MATAVQEALSRLEGVRRSGDGWTARCPAHADTKNSLSVSEDRDGRVLLHCFAGCVYADILAVLGIERTRGYTLANYAGEKRLPVPFLLKLGVDDDVYLGRPAVSIAYRDPTGQVVGKRFRGAGGAKWSQKGFRSIPYGLDRLATTEPDHGVLLVEGESDCHACWLHDLPALGIPGAASWRPEWAQELAGRSVFVWQEPDRGGETFVQKIAPAIPDARVVRPPEGLKDLSELHIRSGDRFLDALSQLMDGARPIKQVLDALDRPSIATTSSSWGEPLPLAPTHASELEVTGLPAWLSAHVESVAASTQTPPSMSLLLAFASIGAAVGGKVSIEVRSGWVEPLNIWVAVVLPPAARKSPVFRRFIAPIEEWEREQALELASRRQTAIDERDALQKALDRAKRHVAKKSDEEDSTAFAEVRRLRARLDRVHIPTLPRVIVSDATAEALAQVMWEQHGSISVLAPEGDVFSLMGGRYTTGGRANWDIYKRGWTGSEAIRVDRLSRGHIHIPHPTLTMGITVQPNVLESLVHSDSFRGEGVLARFLFVVPDSGLGSRRTGSAVPAYNIRAANEYGSRIKTLLAIRPKTDNAGCWQPYSLELSRAAQDVLFAFEAEIEAGLLGPLAPIQDWAGKLVGNVARLTGLLHMAEYSDSPLRATEMAVKESTAKTCVSLGRQLVDHAGVALGLVGTDSSVALARYVLDRAADHVDRTGESPTKRELLRLCQGKRGLSLVSDLDRVLSVLEKHNLVRVVQHPSAGGRPPSPTIEINPTYLRDRDKSDRSPSDGADNQTSVTSVTPPPGDAPDDQGHYEGFV